MGVLQKTIMFVTAANFAAFKEENASRVFAFRSCPSFTNLFQNLPLSVKRKKNSKQQILKETMKKQKTADPEINSGRCVCVSFV
jgi:hypothetical protein